MHAVSRLLCVAFLAASAVGCRCAREQPNAEQPPPSDSAAPASAAAPSAPSADLELLAELPSCEVYHRGLSVDFGTPASRPLRGFSVGPFEDAQPTERAGATFERIRTSKLEPSFWLHGDRENELFVSLRVHGRAATRLFAYIDGHPIGSARLTAGQTEIVELNTIPFKLERGRHTLLLRFNGRLAGPDDAYAEIDWIRVGLTDDLTATYAAPTLRDIVDDFELEGHPRRSLVLRAPSTIRCPVRPASGARLRVALGYWGAGSGTAEVRVVQDGQAPLTLQQRKVTGGDGAKWVPLDIDLSAFAGEIIGVELTALDATGGGRVVFGEPTIGRNAEPTATVPESSTVLVVVGAALDRRRVPPWGPIGSFTALGELVRRGVAYSGYRAPTTITTATFATLLTGVPPRAHAAEDQAARLPDVTRTISETMKAAGCRTAFFTSVPATSAAFGFNVGWDRYEYYPPTKDVAVTEPFTAAARFIEQDPAAANGKRFILIHAAGAHPPWDVTTEEAAALPPEEYGGAIDPRRGGVTLAKIRGRERSARRLTDEEWVRLHALEDAALLKQTRALEHLFDVMKREGLWEDALVIFVGDVSPGDPPRIPYEPAAPLSEDRLVQPLLVRYPRDLHAGEEARAAVSTVDLAPTVLRALGLEVPEHVDGRDLFTVAAGQEPAIGAPHVATLGDTYATRLGSWLLTGEHGSVPRLCRLDVDPACVNDLFDARPIVGQALWRWTFRAENAYLEPGGRLAEREPASIDPDVAAALVVWGDIQ